MPGYGFSPLSRQITDNALVESKNAAVVRKHLGYGPIPAYRAEALNHFNQNVLSPYLNNHRPCLFAVEHVDAKGKIRKTYPADPVATSDEKLKSLPDASSYLKDGIDFETLDAQAHQMSDNEAARQLNDVKAKLVSIHQSSPDSGCLSSRPAALLRLMSGLEKTRTTALQTSP